MEESSTIPVANSMQGADERTPADQFATLFAENWQRLYRFAYHLTRSREEAEELVQQAAEEALRAFPRFRPGTRFDRWLMRILYTSFIDQVRRERRRKLFALDTVPPSLLQAGISSDPEAAVEKSLDGPVRQALDALPPEFRAVVVLVDIEGLSYEEAADVLECPIGTVRSRLHRGRLALREWLRPYVDALKRGDL
ncbi:MAG: sigma-70 family RNA polymerase sigma factor [Armatimonadota bacterium]|nr:sigma-70 family RNA polymerase sigma factor [Armatimonadota bacterium]MDR7435245.1 sigma-70 family RNA polymerase sigma factor [Armatimonadota bacterium]